MISHLSLQLPDKDVLRRTCKAISVLDAILSREWKYRYFSYNAHWSEGEEFFEMRNGEGDQLLVLFRQDGCVINGYCHESPQPSKGSIIQELPAVFNEFMFGEPVKSIGTTFCLWSYEDKTWQHNPGSDNTCLKELLFMFDAEPGTYVKWASEYFEGSYKGDKVSIAAVKKIYNQEPLTRKIVLELVDNIDDWDQLQSDMEEIDYITDLKK
jgi:hypothetical protein